MTEEKKAMEKLKSEAKKKLKHHTLVFRAKKSVAEKEAEEIKEYVLQLQKKRFLIGNAKKNQKLIDQRTAFINLLDSKKIEKPYRFKAYSIALGVSLNSVKRYAFDDPKKELISEFEKILF